MQHARGPLREIKRTTASNRPALAIPIDVPVHAFMRPVSTSHAQLVDAELGALTPIVSKTVGAEVYWSEDPAGDPAVTLMDMERRR